MKNLPKEVDCKRAGAALNRLLPVSFEYAHRKRLDRHLFSRYAEFGDFWERCPENWEEHARGMLAAGAVFGRPKSAAAFVRSAGSQLRQQLDGMIAGMGSGSGKSGESPGVALSKRYGLPPRAIHELMRPALPAVRGALVAREASEMTRRAEHINIEPRTVFEAAPAYRFAEWILDLASARGGVPATQAGYVATDVVRAAYERRIVATPADELGGIGPEGRDPSENLKERMRPRKEADWHRFHELRTIVERVGLLRFDGRRFVADDAVSELLADPASLYRTLLEAMFFRAEWDYNSRLGRVPGLRASAGFLYYVAGVLSEEADEEGWIPMERLGEAFFEANPGVRDAAEKALGAGAADGMYRLDRVQQISARAPTGR